MNCVHSTLLAAGAILVSVASTVSAGTVGYWRYEDGPAGAAATTLVATVGPNATEVAASPDQVFNAEVPASAILDPVAGTTVANTLSLLSPSTDSNAKATAPGATLEPVNFSFETFIKNGSSNGWDTFAGKLRDPAPTDAPNAGTERWTWVLSEDPQGRVSFRMDTDTWDGNGNLVTGKFNDTINFFPTPGGGGPSIFDGNWHHIGISYEDSSKQMSLYIDYVENNVKRTLSNGGTIQYDGGDLVLGGRAGGSWGGYMDEPRLSDEVLVGSVNFDSIATTNQFLVATNIPEPTTMLLSLLGVVSGLAVARRR